MRRSRDKVRIVPPVDAQLVHARGKLPHDSCYRIVACRALAPAHTQQRVVCRLGLRAHGGRRAPRRCLLAVALAIHLVFQVHQPLARCANGLTPLNHLAHGPTGHRVAQERAQCLHACLDADLDVLLGGERLHPRPLGGLRPPSLPCSAHSQLAHHLGPRELVEERQPVARVHAVARSRGDGRLRRCERAHQHELARLLIDRVIHVRQNKAKEHEVQLGQKPPAAGAQRRDELSRGERPEPEVAAEV
mmetsp:Transcript_11045/g.45850  ORF Transcript_11045/g.45850 Transcript_11045/m.45850 type:complete len:247 (+) Transcript_11045:1149-1889(+)